MNLISIVNIKQNHMVYQFAQALKKTVGKRENAYSICEAIQQNKSKQTNYDLNLEILRSSIRSL
ncbi:MAG: hypothetical protein K0Q99_1120 [Clostridia bacterium]|nr:hypothetical protein [Clostridia bacterium]